MYIYTHTNFSAGKLSSMNDAKRPVPVATSRILMSDSARPEFFNDL